MVNGAFGFDPMTVFGDVRKETRNGKKSRKKKDCLECMQEDSMTDGFGLGIDTFSLADPNIDALGIGEGFGSNIIAPAGQANGRGSLARGGFLGIVGDQALTVPSVSGKGRVASRKGKGVRKGRKGVATAPTQSPLQRASGTKFGTVDDKFSENIIGNVRGARKRISDFRIKRKTRQQIQDEPEREPRQLEGKQRALGFTPEEPTAIEQRTPALEDRSRGRTPREEDRDALQRPRRETGSESIARLREENS